MPAAGSWWAKSAEKCANVCNPGENYYEDKPGVMAGCYACENALNSIIFLVDTQSAMKERMGQVYSFIEDIVQENKVPVNGGGVDQ